MSDLNAMARINALMESYTRERDGVAPQQMWPCEDGWYVMYTTGRVQGGPHDGKFLAILYKPVGKGAKTGKAEEWLESKRVASSTRKAARARAERWYYAHSPKKARAHGRVAAI